MVSIPRSCALTPPASYSSSRRSPALAPPTSTPLRCRPRGRAPASLPSSRSSSCRPCPRACTLPPPASTSSSSTAKSVLPSPRSSPVTKNWRRRHPRVF
jgi:hypothetical protein